MGGTGNVKFFFAHGKFFRAGTPGETGNRLRKKYLN